MENVLSYDLVTENALGLCHVLSRPCPKPKPQIWDLSPLLRDQWEIDRSEIQLIRKLGRGNFGEVWYGKLSSLLLTARQSARHKSNACCLCLDRRSVENNLHR